MKSTKMAGSALQTASIASSYTKRLGTYRTFLLLPSIWLPFYRALHRRPLPPLWFPTNTPLHLVLHQPRDLLTLLKRSRNRFFATEHLIIVREVAAANVHITPYGKIAAAFAVASQKANENEARTVKTSSKSIKDGYKKLQDIFDKQDARERVMSGVGGEVTEMDELLGAMAEAREGIQRDKSAEKDEKCRRKAEMEKMRKEMVARSLVRKSKNSPDVEGDVDTQGEEEGSLSNRRRPNGRLRGGMAGELSSFGQALQETDMLWVQLEQERLILERKRLKVEQEEREKERELRREERGACEKLEMDKFKRMIEMFASKLE